MAYETIAFAVAERVATITLNRPDKLNAFTSTMHEELRKALAEIQSSAEIRAAVITGAGRGFCAGQDLQEVSPAASDASRDLGQRLERGYNRLVRTLRSMPKPVVAAVNGVAAGAGANVALACDIVIAARSANFIQAFTRIGLVPDSGGSFALPRRIGLARATALLMTGEALPAERAADWGLIWAAVDDDKCVVEAHALAKRLADGPGLALGLIKRLMNASGTNSLDQQLDLERDFQRLAGMSADYREGVAAFREKRKATFTGR